MKKALKYIIFISGMMFGISLGNFLFPTGKKIAPKVKDFGNESPKKLIDLSME